MLNYTYDYPRPALTADIVLFRWNNGLETLLIQRANEPFKHCWAFPGGFVDEGETADQAAIRELKEETGIENCRLTELFFGSNPNRDPRGWTVTQVFTGFINTETTINAGDDARDAQWFPFDNLPALAFDHHLFIEKTKIKFRQQILQSVFGKDLLPDYFSMDELLKLFLYFVNNIESEALIKRLKELKILIEHNSLCRFEQEPYEGILKNGVLTFQ